MKIDMNKKAFITALLAIYAIKTNDRLCNISSLSSFNYVEH